MPASASTCGCGRERLPSTARQRRSPSARSTAARATPSATTSSSRAGRRPVMPRRRRRQPHLYRCARWRIRSASAQAVAAGSGSAVIVGGGFIGVELAENLRLLGLRVTIVEKRPQLLGQFDADMVSFLHAHMREKGVELLLGARGCALLRDRTAVSSSHGRRRCRRRIWSSSPSASRPKHAGGAGRPDAGRARGHRRRCAYADLRPRYLRGGRRRRGDRPRRGRPDDKSRWPVPPTGRDASPQTTSAACRRSTAAPRIRRC